VHKGTNAQARTGSHESCNNRIFGHCLAAIDRIFGLLEERFRSCFLFEGQEHGVAVPGRASFVG
jgi:hypothetical protein